MGNGWRMSTCSLIHVHVSRYESMMTQLESRVAQRLSAHLSLWRSTTRSLPPLVSHSLKTAPDALRPNSSYVHSVTCASDFNVGRGGRPAYAGMG
eukprot:1775587-Pleurochrysis_carterae.AAC.3